MGDRGKSGFRFRAEGLQKELTEEQVRFLLDLLASAGFDVERFLKEKEAKGEQVITFRDEVMIEVYDKNGNLKERRVIK